MSDAYTADDFKRLLAERDKALIAEAREGRIRLAAERDRDEFRAERDEVLTRMREMDEVIWRRNQVVLSLETELGEERSLRMNAERDRDGYREGSRRLEAERDRYRTALERIAGVVINYRPDGSYDIEDSAMADIAHAALKGGSDE